MAVQFREGVTSAAITLFVNEVCANILALHTDNGSHGPVDFHELMRWPQAVGDDAMKNFFKVLGTLYGKNDDESVFAFPAGDTQFALMLHEPNEFTKGMGLELVTVLFRHPVVNLINLTEEALVTSAD